MIFQVTSVGYGRQILSRHASVSGGHNNDEAPVDTEDKVALWFFIVRGAVLAPYSFLFE